MPKYHIGQIRRLIQKCASIASAHSPQAASDIRRAFKVEPEFSPRKIFVYGAAAPRISQILLDRGEIPVMADHAAEGLFIGTATFPEWNAAERLAKFHIPLLLACDGIALPPGWETDKALTLLHDTAERYEITIEIF